MWIYCGNYWEQRELKEALISEGKPTGTLLRPRQIEGTACDFTSYQPKKENFIENSLKPGDSENIHENSLKIGDSENIHENSNKSGDSQDENSGELENSKISGEIINSDKFSAGIQNSDKFSGEIQSSQNERKF